MVVTLVAKKVASSAVALVDLMETFEVGEMAVLLVDMMASC